MGRKAISEWLETFFNEKITLLYKTHLQNKKTTSYAQALLRKYKYLFLERCRKSNNLWLRALMRSDCLYSSLFFEHYNRILLCD